MEVLDFYHLLLEKGKESFLFKEPLKKYTTWRVGGPADIFYRPENVRQCAEVLGLAWKHDVPVTFLGVGSNVLVADEGIRGLVIQTEGFRELCWRGTEVTVGSGVLLSYLSRLAAEKGLSGLEFAAGIPGSLGGAVVMNAGAYGSCLEEVMVRVNALDLAGTLKEYRKEELDLSYRYSIFKKRKEMIVGATLALKPGESAEIKQLMTGYLSTRREKQPLELPNAGSVFKNTGAGAGRLIEGAGLKGRRIGDAQVSEKHANFIVNLGDAKATDIIALIKEVQEAVRQKYNLELETEVAFLGFTDNGR